MASEPIGAGKPQTGGPHSRTMRLDILPGVIDAAPGVRAATRREAALSLEELSALFQEAYDATLVTDIDGVILQGNRRAHEFLRGGDGDLSGVDVASLISGAGPSLVPQLAQALETERFVRVHAWCAGRGVDFFPAEIAVYRSGSGDSSHLCFFIRDITWRKEAEDRLQMVDSAMRTARTGIAMLDTDGMVTYANPAMNALCGLAPDDEFPRRPLSSFFSDPSVMESLAESIARGEAWSGRIDIVRDDGSTATDCDAAPLFDSDGEGMGAVLSFTDISDAIRAQEAEKTLERNRVMIESVGTVCHHLGQPSTVLLGALEMLKRDSANADGQKTELLDMSLKAAETIAELLRELNDLTIYRSEGYAHSGSIVSIG